MTNPTPAAAPGNAVSPYPRIFMQWHGDGEPKFPLPLDCEITWCSDRINESDVEYVPASELAALTAERAWKPISTAPKDGTEVLLSFDASKVGPSLGPNIVAVGGFLGDNWHLTCIWASSQAHFSPTHWMPLPTPPQP